MNVSTSSFIYLTIKTAKGSIIEKSMALYYDLPDTKKDALEAYITVLVESGLFIRWVRQICVQEKKG